MSVWRKQYPNAPLREPSGDWFVNRTWELDTLWAWASSIPNKGSCSITGLRRTGKSSIMAKIYNRLYFEQEKIVPIYISFGEYLHTRKPITAQQFAQAFMAGAVRSYLAFTYDRPGLQDNKLKYSDLEDLATELSDEVTLDWFRRQKRSFADSSIPSHSVVQWSVDFLGAHASAEHPMLIMIDEFQVLTQVLYPEDGRVMDITDSFQYASENWEAPLLVSGSSISMLQGEALGGLLSGRFSPYHIGPLEGQHAIKMITYLGEARDIPVTEELAEEIVKTTQGFPYSIESIMLSRSPDVARFPDVDAVADVVNFELSHHTGTLGRHYEEEYGKYVTELNGDDLTRKILYWITNQKELALHIHPRRVAKEINAEVLDVQKSLEKLYRLDIIQLVTGAVYTGPTDPLMRLYLNYSHYLNIENLSPDDAAKELERKLNQQQGEMNRQTGHFTEIIVGGAVRAFDHRTVDGTAYFGIAGDVHLPRCRQIRRREGTITAGKAHEVDLIGEYRLYNLPEDVDHGSNAIFGAWVVSVRYRGKRMGVADVRKFIRDVEVVQAEREYGEIVRWYFSKSGFTKDAKALLQSEKIYHSDLEQFNLLGEIFDLLPLKM